MEKVAILELKKRYGKNKTIPKLYEENILRALSHYPELVNIHIEFSLAKKHPVPYGTAPLPGAFLKPRSKRKYNITLLEEAKEPERSALFKNLSAEARLGVLGHELAHVVQYNACSRAGLIKTGLLFSFKKFRQRMEKNADRLAIEHGLGEQLYKHAVYIRSIPGYTEKRPEIEENYLQPHVILEHIQNLKIDKNS
jgi:hypothetical protein